MTDQQIARLFSRRQQLERELMLVDARIKAARQHYADRNGLLMLPSIDNMRKAVTS